MTPTITALDPSAALEADLKTVYDLNLACSADAAPEAPVLTFAEWLGFIRLMPSHLRKWHWTTPGGFASLDWHVGTDSAGIELCVAAHRRREGIGTALLGVAQDQARQLGCRTLFASYRTPAGADFAAASGAKAGNSQHQSVLVMPMSQPSAQVAGYQLRSWTDGAPQDLLDSYAAARNAIHDAPTSEGTSEEHWTPEMVRESEAVTVQRGRQTRVTVALAVDAMVAGFTQVRVSAEPGAVAWTEETATVGAHRGKGLAAWVKSESLRRLAEDRPDVTFVTTFNDTTNAAMLAVNRKLGFRVVSTWTDAVLQL